MRIRKAFTLVEMLVVIVILGILAALVSGAAVGAMRAARQGKIVLEINALASGLEAYKLKYGEYPPNFTDSSNLDAAAAISRHFRKAFPRIDATELTKLPTSLSADEAIVFWLGGFSANPQFPLTGPGGPMCPQVDQRRTSPLFQFEEGRLTRTRPGDSDPDVFFSYHHPGFVQPYIYFDTSRDIPGAYNGITPIQDDHGHAVEPHTFQILSAGLDDDWGDPTKQPIFPPPSTPEGGWKDNLASFSDKNFEDSVP